MQRCRLKLLLNGDQNVLKLVPANRLQAKVEIGDAILVLLRLVCRSMCLWILSRLVSLVTSRVL